MKRRVLFVGCVLLVSLVLGWFLAAVAHAEVNSAVDHIAYSGNGTTKAFTFAFGIFSTANLRVVCRTTASGAEAVQALNVAYTVSDNDGDGDYTDGTPGGTVTFLTAPASGVEVHISRSVPLTQTSDIDATRTVRLGMIEDAIDNLVHQTQFLRGLLYRVPLMPETERQVSDMNLPATGSGYFYLDSNRDIQLTLPTDLEGVDANVTTGWLAVLEGDANGTERIDARDELALNQVVYAIDYNAIPDDDVNDTAEILAAMTAAGDYGTVVLDPGTYNISQLTFNNPITLRGAGSAIQNRWNTRGGCVTLLADGTEDPAILIGGDEDSLVKSTTYGFSEGVRLENFLLKRGDGTGRGILIDGSTTLEANRGSVRDLELLNVHVADFNDHNVELLGSVYDVRFKGCSFADCNEDTVIGTSATAWSGAGKVPSQIHFYDCYSYGNRLTSPLKWAMNGRFAVYGGGIAYGNGFKMESGSCLYGTHVEGYNTTADSIGIQINGPYCKINTKYITAWDTAIQIGDGTSGSVAGYVIETTTISGCNQGILITAGGSRDGVAIAHISGDLYDVNDLRSATDGVHNSMEWLNASSSTGYNIVPPTKGEFARGTTIWNDSVAAGSPIGWRAITGLPTTYWTPMETVVGDVALTGDSTLTDADTGRRFSNDGAVDGDAEPNAITITLPAATTTGLRYSFSIIDANDMIIDPDGTNHFKGGTGNGKYLRLDDTGCSVTFECLETNSWTITAAFDPNVLSTDTGPFKWEAP